MSQQNTEDNTNQKLYLEFYQDKVNKADQIGLFICAVPVLIFSILATASLMKGELLFTDPIFFAVSIFILVVISLCFAAWIHIRDFITILGAYFAISIIALALFLFSIAQWLETLLGLYVAFFVIPFYLGSNYVISERSALKSAKEVKKYIKTDEPEEHTAVILPHDKNRAMDGGDKTVLQLLEVLYEKENFQVYLCLFKDEMKDVLKKSTVKRIWIFGHGTRGSCSLTDGPFTYSDFMTEKVGDNWKIREVPQMEYVYQCHCNQKSTTPLTEYLVKKRGALHNDQKMLNYYDSGLANLKIDRSLESDYKLLSYLTRICSYVGKKLDIDLNYNIPLSIKYLIDRYEEHLERRANNPAKSNIHESKNG